MYIDFMIIDAHAHMFTEKMFLGMQMPKYKVPQSMIDSVKHTLEENKKAWIDAMDKAGIEKTIFMSTVSLNEEFSSFINSSNRFIGFAKINPESPDAIETLKKELSMGMKGVKLYATSGEFNVGSQSAYPFYEYCEKNKIPITIHFGVTIGRTADLYTGNPIHLSRVLGEFPNLTFIIAHFGAGFFREVLMLKYKRDNLYIETSGTNNWLPHQDNFLTLKDIFKKSLEIFGPEKMIYGSDTRIFPDGYRYHILKQQQDILDELNVSRENKEKIMYDNINNLIR